jgi:hypothetical protein
MKTAWERLSDHAKDMIIQSRFDGQGLEDATEDQLEEISEECETELWRHFLEYESDPDICIDCYRALFEPNYDAQMEVFDYLWTILQKLNPTGFNSTYAQVLIATGRVDELSKYLQEFSDGLSKKE